MIGLSLSFCVSRIVSGEVDVNDVEYIVAGTAISDPADWNDLIERYKSAYWIPSKNDPPNYTANCEGVCRLLIALGKVRQPKLTENRAPIIDKGVVWVNSPDQIRYSRWKDGRPTLGPVVEQDED
jgi:hypothetical protein